MPQGGTGRTRQFRDRSSRRFGDGSRHEPSETPGTESVNSGQPASRSGVVGGRPPAGGCWRQLSSRPAAAVRNPLRFAAGSSTAFRRIACGPPSSAGLPGSLLPPTPTHRGPVAEEGAGNMSREDSGSSLLRLYDQVTIRIIAELERGGYRGCSHGTRRAYLRNCGAMPPRAEAIPASSKAGEAT